jgi:folate-binding protein YgfZ
MPPVLTFDRSDRTRLSISGTHATTTLNGLVSNDVAALAPGSGAYATLLTAKGKMIADVRIFARAGAEGFLVDCSARASEGARAVFAKYVNPRFATVADVSASEHDIGVFGDGASAIVSAVAGVPETTLRSLAEYAHVAMTSAYGPLVIARVPDLGHEGYDFFVGAAHAPALRDAVIAAGAPLGDATAWEQRRVAAGRPAWGADADMDDTTLPQEANIDLLGGVSYTKGCYVGQETVARIHFRGHVNKTLRRLRLELSDVHSALPPHGSKLLTDSATDSATVVGDVRSVARQPDGSVLAIGMVRREVEHGATLRVRSEETTAEAHVLGWAGAADPATV